ncbi:hypothetical protein MMB232_00624 [Brevundimonas subvibrioides]|uniref:DUF6880 family protein n=1 Tax=Brevundimonas subvibrioides TaxID=74313 RepID=UPI0032D5AE9B
MAPRSAASRKALNASNLAGLGADTLARLLVEASAGDGGLKRRLKLELAAEVGSADLAAEIDRRFTALASSRTRVSWRKRPELLRDLTVHRRMIADRLLPVEPALALDRLMAWFDLYPGLAGRVKDPKGELALLYFEAAADLAGAANAAGPAGIAPLVEALQTRQSEWSNWIGRAAPDFRSEIAQALLDSTLEGRAAPTGRLALVVRKLADRCGDVMAWAAAIPKEDAVKPDIGAEIARRFAERGHAAEARAALEAARPRAPEPARWTRRTAPAPTPEPSPAWDSAEIAVLEAEGETARAQTARWAAFERTLSGAHLDAFVSRLADFDDVEALDRAHAIAALWPDPAAGLAFLMNRGALRDGAAMVLARSEALSLSEEDTALWAGRFEGRFPAAALALVRRRATGLARAGLGRSELVRALSAEAARLAELPGAVATLESHAAFIDGLERLSPTASGRGWR